MKVNNLGQISVEYLIILGVAVAAILPAGYFFYQYSINSNDNAIRSQIETIGNQMLTNAESVYGLAEGSKISLEVNLPNKIKDIIIINQEELIIKYELSTGITESVFFSKIKLSGNISYPQRQEITPPGINTTITKTNIIGKNTLLFESKNNYVLITKKWYFY